MLFVKLAPDVSKNHSAAYRACSLVKQVLTLGTKLLRSFKMSQTNDEAKQRHITEDTHPQQQHCENLQCCMSFFINWWSSMLMPKPKPELPTILVSNHHSNPKVKYSGVDSTLTVLICLLTPDWQAVQLCLLCYRKVITVFPSP